MARERAKKDRRPRGRTLLKVLGILLVAAVLCSGLLILLPWWSTASVEKQINSANEKLKQVKTLLGIVYRDLQSLEKHWNVSPLQSTYEKLVKKNVEFKKGFHQVAKPFFQKIDAGGSASQMREALKKVNSRKLSNLSKNLQVYLRSVDDFARRIRMIKEYTTRGVRSWTDCRNLYERFTGLIQNRPENVEEIRNQANSFQEKLNQGETLLKKGMLQMMVDERTGVIMVTQAINLLADLSIRGGAFLEKQEGK